MYFIKFDIGAQYKKVLVRNKKKKEDIKDYHKYVTRKILNKMADALVSEEELETGVEYKFFERNKRKAYYKKEYVDVAEIVANEKLEEKNIHYSSKNTKKVKVEKVENKVKETEEEIKTLKSYSKDELTYLLHKNNPKINFWYSTRKNSNQIYMDFDALSEINLPDGYFYNDDNSIADSEGNIIYVDDVVFARKYSIKKSSVLTRIKMFFKNMTSLSKKKIAKKNSSSIYDELVENYETEKTSIHDELVENYDQEKSSIYDELVENYQKEENKKITNKNNVPKYQVKEVTDQEILSSNVYSNSKKNEVMTRKANDVLEDMKNSQLKSSSNLTEKTNVLDVESSNVNFPPRLIDCGCGIIEICGDEFAMLVESKYEVLKENPEQFNKLSKTQKESFDAYLKKELKNAFDYSKKGKVKLLKTEYDKLLKIHSDYFKLCTIRREREYLLERKNAIIEEQIAKLVENINKDFEQGQENLTRAEDYYTNSLKDIKLEKVIKK